MKTKFKNLLLYSLATIGVVALFISATQTQVSHSTVPESHVWEMQKGAGQTSFLFNKVSGEVRLFIQDRKDAYWVPKEK